MDRKETGEAALRGTSGEVSWFLSRDFSCLTFRGRGRTADYGSADETPWFHSLAKITRVVAEEGVTALGANCLNGAVSLNTISLSSTVEMTGVHAFENCSGLKSVHFPEGLRIIRAMSFRGCGNLAVLHLPASLSNIDFKAFCDASQIREVYYAGNREQWENVDISLASSGNISLVSADIHYLGPEPDMTAFDDIDGDSGQGRAVRYLNGYGFMEPVSGSRFGSDMPFGQEELLRILYRRAGEPGMYSSAGEWALRQGIVPEITTAGMTVGELYETLDRSACYNRCGCARGNYGRCGCARGNSAAQSRNCAAQNRNCAAQSRNCAVQSRDCAAQSRNCAAQSRDCAARSRNCAVQSRDCTVQTGDCPAQINVPGQESFPGMTLDFSKELTRGQAAEILAAYLQSPRGRANRYDWQISMIRDIMSAGGDGRMHILTPDLTTPGLTEKVGDCTFLLFPGGETMLIDSGVEGAGDRVLSFIDDLGLSRLDYFVLSHPHGDHVGNALRIARILYEEKGGGIGSYWYYGYRFRVKEPALREYLAERGTEIRLALRAGDVEKVGDVTVEFFNPTDELLENLPDEGDVSINATSLVMKFVYGRSSYLTCGDLYVRDEEELASRYGSRLRADVLKADHHGLFTSNSSLWTGTISPKLIVAENADVGDSLLMEQANRKGVAWVSSGRMGLITVSFGREGEYELITQRDSRMLRDYHGTLGK